MEKNKEILKKLLEKVEKKPDSIEGYEELFDYYISNEMKNEAISVLEIFLEIKKDYPEGECHLGIMYLNRGDLERAEERFLRALKIEPEMKDANFNLGFLYMTYKKYRESLLFFKKVIDQDPADIETLFNVAECCVEIGKRKYAEFFYQKVLKLDPNHKEAKEGLAKIKVDKKGIKKYSERVRVAILFEFYHKINMSKKGFKNKIYDEKRMEHLKTEYLEHSRADDFSNQLVNAWNIGRNDRSRKLHYN